LASLRHLRELVCYRLFNDELMRLLGVYNVTELVV